VKDEACGMMVARGYDDDGAVKGWKNCRIPKQPAAEKACRIPQKPAVFPAVFLKSLPYSACGKSLMHNPTKA
jgi:hypothetical protein